MLRKIYFVLTICALFFMTACGTAKDEVSLPPSEKEESSVLSPSDEEERSSLPPSDEEGSAPAPLSPADAEGAEAAEVILSDPELDLQLCASQNTSDSYRGLSVRYKGQSLPISGSTLNQNFMFPPSLLPFDSASKAAVILVTGEGTGMFLMDLHVIDLSQMEEIPCDSPLDWLDSHLTSRVSGGIATLSLPDRDMTFDLRETDPANLYEEAGSGGTVKYALVNEELYAEVPIQISPVVNLGYVTLKYALQDGRYAVTQVDFSLYEDDSIPCEIRLRDPDA